MLGVPRGPALFLVAVALNMEPLLALLAPCAHINIALAHPAMSSVASGHLFCAAVACVLVCVRCQVACDGRVCLRL